MRFLVDALHARYTEHVHDVVMSRYSAVHITCGQAPGAIHFIVVLEPCIVCELLPFQHSCSWITVTGRRRLQRPCGFSQLWCCCTSVWLMRATRHIDLTQLVAASSGEAKINSSHCSKAAPPSSLTWASGKLIVENVLFVYSTTHFCWSLCSHLQV